MNKLKYLIAIVFVIVVILYVMALVLSNHSLADIDLVVIQFKQVPVEVLILSSFIVGALAGLVSASALLFLSYRINKQLLKRYTQHIG